MKPTAIDHVIERYADFPDFPRYEGDILCAELGVGRTDPDARRIIALSWVVNDMGFPVLRRYESDVGHELTCIGQAKRNGALWHRIVTDVPWMDDDAPMIRIRADVSVAEALAGFEADVRQRLTTLVDDELNSMVPTGDDDGSSDSSDDESA